MKKYALILALVTCTGCTHSLKLANGMVDWNYENENFNGLDAERTNHVSVTKDGEVRSTTIKVDTGGD
jgi:hypothetical protein